MRLFEYPAMRATSAYDSPESTAERMESCSASRARSNSRRQEATLRRSMRAIKRLILLRVSFLLLVAFTIGRL